MQLISTDTKLFFNFLKTFFAHENITKLPSIYGPGWNFQYCQLAPNQVKSHILFHKNGKPRDLCVVLWLKYFSSLGDRFDALSVKFTHSQLKFIWRIKNILKPSQNKKGQRKTPFLEQLEKVSALLFLWKFDNLLSDFSFQTKYVHT